MSRISTRSIVTIGAAGAALALVLTGCSAVSGGSAGNGGGSKALPKITSVTYENPLPSYPAFNVAGKCFKAQAKKEGWKATEVGITGTAVDNQGSINEISQAIASGTDGLLAFPTVNSLFTPVFKQARAKGIYVVALNTGDPSTGQQTQVGTDNASMGKLMADGLGAAAPDSHVAFISVSQDTQAQKDQITGFQNEAAAKYPNMQTTTVVYDNGDATKDVDLIANTMAAHPDINAWFLTEGAAIPGAITAVKEAGKTGSVKLLGLDLTADTQADLTAGTLFGVGDQGWCDMGTKAIIAMKDLSEGKKVPAVIATKNTFYTKDNLPSN